MIARRTAVRVALGLGLFLALTLGLPLLVWEWPFVGTVNRVERTALRLAPDRFAWARWRLGLEEGRWLTRQAWDDANRASARFAAGDMDGCASLARRAVRRGGWCRRLLGRTGDDVWKSAVERLNRCDPRRALDAVEKTELAFGATWRATFLAKGGRLDAAERVLMTSRDDGRPEEAWAAIAVGAIEALREDLARRAASRVTCAVNSPVAAAAANAGMDGLAADRFEACGADPWTAVEHARWLAKAGRVEEANALGATHAIGDVVALELFQAALARKELDDARVMASETSFSRQVAGLALVRAYLEAGRVPEAEALLFRIEELWSPMPGPRWVEAAIEVTAALRRAGASEGAEALARDLVAVANDPTVSAVGAQKATLSSSHHDWVRSALGAGVPDLALDIWEGSRLAARGGLADVASVITGTGAPEPAKAVVERVMPSVRAFAKERPFTAQERAGDLASALAGAGFVDEAFEVIAMMEKPGARWAALLEVGLGLHFKGGEGAERRGEQLVADGRFD